MLWYLFVPKCSQLEEKLGIEFNIRLSRDINKMRRTFPKEMVHVTALIRRTPGYVPSIEWMEENEELGHKERKGRAARIAALRREEEQEGGRAWRPLINVGCGLCVFVMWTLWVNK